MSKPVLGRGLGSLLNGSGGRGPSGIEEARDPAGVQLLLRGTDGKELVQPVRVFPKGDAHPGFPRWALAGAVVVDGVLLLLAAGIAMFGGGVGWMREAAVVTLVLIGGAVLSAAVWLRGQAAIRELESLNPLAEEKPRLRVQFMDELPRRRE